MSWPKGKTAWNIGKNIGQKKPLTVEQVRTIKSILTEKKDQRGLAMFCFAIDSMLRASDLTRLHVEDVTRENPDKVDQVVFITQKKTKGRHHFFLTEPTREVVKAWIDAAMLNPEDRLFCMGVENYRYQVKKWVKLAGLRPSLYSTHSLRRTKASIIYRKTNNVEAVMQLLGHRNLNSVHHYLGTTKDEALDIAANTKIWG